MKAEDYAKRQQEQYKAVNRLMNTPDGKVLRDMLMNEVAAESFDPDPYKTAFNEGKRKLALNLTTLGKMK